LDIKKLGGHKELYRLKVGGYRLIYTVKNNELLIFMLLIGNRGDVYKKLN
jgi:mRNA interferase RelE/StbE